MGKEIERKFLIKNDEYKKFAKGAYYHQGYLNSDKERIVRIRIIDDKGFITVKGISVGPTRQEYEYEIPFSEAKEMLNQLCEKPTIEKYRYKIPLGEFVWEIDEFHGKNEGLVVGEIELKSEDQKFLKPDWVGKEVTDDPKYFNSNLVKNPYSKW
ncbi:MAG: CYTH domain-containing protein [Bacteroidales bacterium]|nr:CYTH domain-containing protein [Bacteroidales bacterium]